MWFFDEMQLRGLQPDLTQYNAAIRGCGTEGEWEMSLSLLRGEQQWS